MAVKAVPEGYHTATPYLIVKGASEAIEFCGKAFGAKELMRFADTDGKVGHAEMQIGNSRIMIADEYPEMGFRGPKTLGGSSVLILLYVEDVDECFARAIAAGGKVLKPVADQPYGDRAGTLSDPFGHLWSIATHIEDLSQEEIERRFEASSKG